MLCVSSLCNEEENIRDYFTVQSYQFSLECGDYVSSTALIENLPIYCFLFVYIFFFLSIYIIEMFPTSKGAQIYDNFGSDKLWLRLKRSEYKVNFMAIMVRF